MGQKVNPMGMRVQLHNTYHFTWYAHKKDYADQVFKDYGIYQYLNKRYSQAGVSNISIERPAQNAYITLTCAKPGPVIGKQGKDVETLRKILSNKLGVPAFLTVKEVKKKDLVAKLVAENIAGQLERREQYRKAMKRAIQTVMASGAKGVKVMVSGRLAGAEIARSEEYKQGRVPLHTFKADIDYHLAIAKTVYGIIGVKVWVFKGLSEIKPVTKLLPKESEE